MNFLPQDCELQMRRKRAGWTLPEMMVSVVAGMLILISVSSAYIFMLRNLDATANYEELDRQSRNAIDVMTTLIRETGAMTNFTTNFIQFTNQDGSQLAFVWDRSNYVWYTNNCTTNGGPYTGLLLSNCNYLSFSIFQRNPSNTTAMDFYPATQASDAKIVLINWTCTRTNYLTLRNTESVQTAKVVLRN